MTDDRKRVGAAGERAARQYLERRGYRVVQANYRCFAGEIDIIAQVQDTLVFVEVRTRTGTTFGSPEESITRAKKAKLIQLAHAYLQEQEAQDPDWRIDVVAVEMNGAGRITRLEHIENALH